RTHGLLTKYTLVHNTELVSNGYLKYQTKRHQLNQTKANDSRYIELGTGFTYKDAQTMMYGMNLIYANEKQFNHTANNTIDKQSLNIKANILHTLTSNFTLSPSISYKYSDYQAIDRSDNEYKLALTGTYSHSSTLLFQVVVDDTRVYSNSNNDEYKKNTFTFNLIKAF
ncbi:MAG: outer membrane beta-barrel protein, partial [Campylobacterota bacterium]|nr:outer membrane beta-barrel protein [Campylobacterota bacterium]